MKSRWGKLLPLLIVPALVATACGDDDDDTSASSGAPTSAAASSTTGSSEESASTSAAEITQASAETTPAEPAEPVRLIIGSQDPKALPALALLTLAEEKGWWEEEGLDVELLPGTGGGNIVQALVAGSTDIAIANPSATVPALLGGADIKLIGSWYNYTAVDFLSFDTDAEMQGAVLGYSSAGSLGNFMVDAYAADHPELGITGQAVGGLGDLVAAAREGLITAFNVTPPYTQQFVSEGAKVLIKGRDMVGDMPTGLIAARTAYAEEHPEALAAFWRVYDRAFQYLVDDPETAAPEVAEIMEVDEVFVLDSITGDNAIGFTIQQDAEALKNAGDLLLQAGVVDKPIDWAAIVDQQYLPESARADLSAISAG